MIRTLLLTALLPLSAIAAESPMTAEEFDSYSQGKTFYYGAEGRAYGVEEYLSDRRVRWSFLDGRCKEGHWYEANGLICFVYEDGPDDPQCWTFFQRPAGIVARFENDPLATELYEVEKSTEPMQCMGPDVGV
ncbi:hypothetical protein ATO6_09300 [Oceanicola sp. 22II-s10i]|uniref:hypothetical protein n=1 Tax=Oceanicola sp. 22II-s10i TaxID=1317116 RepID=UPI000B52657D|nr:hypothetical protein [Oceanicola sp. 22II-s10i]OWU85376.1 hypothetical protein ATO6_09300 [Oceanicola sp. 22II-s10i]